MFKRISTSTASTPLGLPSQTKLFEVASGQYRGRKVALVQTSSGEIRMTWADPPFVSWSALQTVADDAADQPFDAAMDASGNIHVVYTESAGNDLHTCMVSFAGGSFEVGPAVTVFSLYESFNPSLAIEPSGKIWVAWARKSSGSYYLQAKASTDGGAIWGSGPTDGGDVLSAAVSLLYPRLVCDAADIYVIYSQDGDKISTRHRQVAGSSWDAAVDIATSPGNMDQHFDAALSQSGLLGVVWDEAGLKYRQFDSAAWDAVVELDGVSADWPQIRFEGNAPVVTWLSTQAAGQCRLMYCDRRTGLFSSPMGLDPAAGFLDKVLLYHFGSFNYADVTAECSDAASADVYHPSSGAMVKDAYDCLCLGMDHPFRFLRVLLSTAGSGGTVAWSYWNGVGWVAFTPSSGAYHLDEIDKEVVLWEDYESIPDDWQKAAVDGDTPRFWIRAQVESSYTAPPVGSRITASSNLTAASVRR